MIPADIVLAYAKDTANAYGPGWGAMTHEQQRVFRNDCQRWLESVATRLVSP